MTNFDCPGQAERYIRAKWNPDGEPPEMDKSQHDIREYVARATGLVCFVEQCPVDDIGGECLTTVCVYKKLPERGFSAACTFAAICEYSAETDVLSKERRSGVCEASRNIITAE